MAYIPISSYLNALEKALEELGEMLSPEEVERLQPRLGPLVERFRLEPNRAAGIARMIEYELAEGGPLVVLARIHQLVNEQTRGRTFAPARETFRYFKVKSDPSPGPGDVTATASPVTYSRPLEGVSIPMETAVSGPPPAGRSRARSRWLMARFFDSRTGRQVNAFRRGGEHRLDVMVGHGGASWLIAEGTPEQSLEKQLGPGEHKLSVHVFIPSLDLHQTVPLTLPPETPSAIVAFGFRAPDRTGKLQILVSLLYQQRVLQTAKLEAELVTYPTRSKARPSFQLQALVPDFGSLDHRSGFDAAIVATRLPDGRSVASGVSQKSGEASVALFSQAPVDRTSKAVRDILSEVITEQRDGKPWSRDEMKEVLWRLAQEGVQLHEYIAKRLAIAPSEKPGRVQVIQVDPPAFIPIEFVYDLPVPAPGAKLCPSWLDGSACKPADHATDEVGHAKVVCPSGFWGLSKIIQRQIIRDPSEEDLTGKFQLRAGPARADSIAPFRRALFGWSDILDNVVKGSSKAVLQRLNEVMAEDTLPARSWKDWTDGVKSRPTLMVLLSHTAERSLELGSVNSTQQARRTVAQITKSFVVSREEDKPIVLLLGCGTAVSDEDIYSFVSRFGDMGAAVVVGTITSVLGEHAAKVVNGLLEQLAKYRGQPVAEIIRRTRNDLLVRGELTALCATAYGDSDCVVN